jgi:YfiR/HmsC-like
MSLRGTLTRCVAGSLPILLCLHVLLAQSPPPKPTEYEVKATYLSNFGKFAEWPAVPPGAQDQAGGTTDSFNICVLGTDPFGSALTRAVTGESINRVPMAAKRISKVQDAVAGCRILFIGSSEDGKLKAILAALGNASVLTVGESPAFAQRGGMIQFVLDNNHIRFEVNLAAVQRARLTLSSELTKLATVVRRDP